MRFRAVAVLLLVLLLLAGSVFAAQDTFDADARTPEEDAFAWWMIPVALAVFAAGGFGVSAIVRRSRRFAELEDETEEGETV